ncbi:hypothetical protein DFH27DRAFT_523786 [Peziza echinospora]|nr:hypothetical protein DFH27DRAFT_523786 [Peziza echinospora]
MHMDPPPTPVTPNPHRHLAENNIDDTGQEQEYENQCTYESIPTVSSHFPVPSQESTLFTTTILEPAMTIQKLLLGMTDPSFISELVDHSPFFFKILDLVKTWQASIEAYIHDHTSTYLVSGREVDFIGKAGPKWTTLVGILERIRFQTGWRANDTWEETKDGLNYLELDSEWTRLRRDRLSELEGLFIGICISLKAYVEPPTPKGFIAWENVGTKSYSTIFFEKGERTARWEREHSPITHGQNHVA